MFDRFDGNRVYPRVGGETGRAGGPDQVPQGLSPRGRGNHRRIQDIRAGSGSIPAWAGKPVSQTISIAAYPVYPRVGGETMTVEELGKNAQGLSPRGRGNLHAGRVSKLFNGSIPAWAGKPWLSSRPRYRCWVYPRVGGETLRAEISSDDRKGLSPRGRGNLDQHGRQLRPLRSIPAWAGKPCGDCGSSDPSPVYPRVGGETLQGQILFAAPDGLSPRGRGNPAAAAVDP